MAFPTQFSTTVVIFLVSACFTEMEKFLIFLEHIFPKTEQREKGILIAVFPIHLLSTSRKREKQSSLRATLSHEVFAARKETNPLKKQYCFSYWNENN